MPSRSLHAAVLVALLGLLPRAASAFELTPISREFTPTGSGAVQPYTVENKGEDPIAIEVTIATRALDPQGEERNTDAEDEFLIYPPQVIVPAGGRQTIRVTWLGDPAPAKELAYRLRVQQVSIGRFKPIAASKDKATGAVEILMNYRGSIYIRPKGTRPALDVKAARLERSASKEPQLAVTLHNRGTAHAALKDYKVEVKRQGPGAAVWLSPGALELKNAVILADGSRQLSFPWPHGFEPGEVTVHATGR
jgi:fimbrial chaperone protein